MNVNDQYNDEHRGAVYRPARHDNQCQHDQCDDERRGAVYRYRPDRQDQDNQCQHDQCEECHGRGVRGDGWPCVHSLVCNCPKCRSKVATWPFYCG